MNQYDDRPIEYDGHPNLRFDLVIQPDDSGFPPEELWKFTDAGLVAYCEFRGWDAVDSALVYALDSLLIDVSTLIRTQVVREKIKKLREEQSQWFTVNDLAA